MIIFIMGAIVTQGKMALAGGTRQQQTMQRNPAKRGTDRLFAKPSVLKHGTNNDPLNLIGVITAGEEVARNSRFESDQG